MESLELAESAILKNMLAGALVVEKNSGKIVFVNDRFIELLGSNPKGCSFKEYALNIVRARKLDGSPYLFEQLPLTEALLYGKGTANQEMVLQKSDKTDRIVRVNAKPLNNDKGEIIGGIATFEDITELKKAEQALKTSEEDYRSLFDNMVDGLACCQMIFSDKGKPIDFVNLKINDAFERITGLKRETLIGKNVTDAIPGIEKANPEVIELYGRVALTGKSESFEIFVKPLDIWLHVSAYSIEKGYFVAIFHDISERKKAEEALRVSEEHYRGLFNNIEDGFELFEVIYDNAGAACNLRYLEVNATYERQSGILATKVVGKTLTEAFPNIEHVWIEKFGKVAQTGESTSFEDYNQSTNRHYHAYAFCFAENQVGVLFKDITEKRIAEEALKESEQLYRTLFENTDDGFQLFKPLYDEVGNPIDLLVLKVNKTYERQTGLKESDVIGKTVKESIPNIETYWITTYGNVAKTGKSVHIENYNQSTDRWYDVYAFPYAKDQVGALFRDITERKKTEEALKQSEIKFRTVANFTRDWEQWISPEGMLIYVSPSCERITGFRPEEFIKDPDLLVKIIYPDDKALVESHYRSIDSKELPDVDYRIITRSGEVRWIGHTCQPVFDDKGKWLGRRGSNRDITERKKTEEALRQNEERFFKAFHSNPAAMTIAQLPSGVWVNVNESFLRLTEYSREEVIGHTSAELNLFVGDPAESAQIINLLSKQGNVNNLEISAQTKTGKPLRLLLSAVKTVLSDQEYAITTQIDITEIRRLEKRLKDSERLSAIGQIAGMVGHDIRNPLQAITSELYLAKTEIDEMPKGSKEETLKESVDLIQKQVGYIDKIVNDLQDYARPLKPELVEVDLCSAVPEALSTVEIPPNIQSEMSCDLPELKLKMDLTFLKRIMVNLVNNAIQAMPDGGKLTVRVSSEEGKAVVTVEDTGVGIPKEVQEKLFTPLFTTKAKGQGFGLVAIKRMTEALGGTINFESEAGKGTKFIMELPIK